MIERKNSKRSVALRIYVTPAQVKDLAKLREKTVFNLSAEVRALISRSTDKLKTTEKHR